MAKDVRDAAEATGVEAADLKRVIAEAVRQKQLASEYAGNAATVTRGAVEQYGLEKTAFTFARRLSEMEDAKRDAVVVALIDYCEKLGFLDGGLFPDELIARLQAIIDRAHNAVPSPRSAADKAADDAILKH